MIGIYCPSCGQEFEHEPENIAPGAVVEWTCPSCEIEFDITMNYQAKNED